MLLIDQNILKNNLKELSYQKEEFYHLRAQYGSMELLHREHRIHIYILIYSNTVTTTVDSVEIVQK